MKEKPILFSTPMVQAILMGRKTMTRRVVKLPSGVSHDEFTEALYPFFFLGDERECCIMLRQDTSGVIINPPYRIGDRLWVRETWSRGKLVNDDGDVVYNGYLYKATDIFDNEDADCDFKWKPSIHMPKSACRLWLEVTDVRVERLQDISEEDAIAEGIGAGFQMNDGWPDYQHIKNGRCTLTQDTAKMSFASLWDLINGKKYPWASNSWVWVIEFKRL